MEYKDLNEVLAKMKYGDNLQPSNKFITTDFTPKKKPNFKIRFKISISNLIKSIKKSKILMKIKTWFNKTIINPIKTKRDKRRHNRYVKELKSNFAKKFNVDVDKTIETMNKPGYSPANIDNNKLLVKNRLEINKRKSLYKFAPFIYDVEIVDIHNENLNSELPSVNDIINDENEKSKTTLDKQNDFFIKRPELTKGKNRVRTNTTFFK